MVLGGACPLQGLEAQRLPASNLCQCGVNTRNVKLKLDMLESQSKQDALLHPLQVCIWQSWGDVLSFARRIPLCAKKVQPGKRNCRQHIAFCPNHLIFEWRRQWPRNEQFHNIINISNTRFG